ncbi:hypothetical protein SKAU_G00289220 [Synaphobranchus kaupii]|uniref:Reverse transcriptase domain-containing protein n=1 Tax=Synaphobranchus kaupii TaxID=118154 RepID=A0A9Q1ILX3_SYNKA|nr:hypothetical protein SKAU_G00289220 [Synaphobranchus kaupii]
MYRDKVHQKPAKRNTSHPTTDGLIYKSSKGQTSKGDSNRQHALAIVTGHGHCHNFHKDEVSGKQQNRQQAFDIVDHARLLQHLVDIELCPRLLAWIHSFTTGRRQRVMANCTYSPWSEVTSGVPQGGMVSPYLFLLHMSTRNTIFNNTLEMGYGDDVGLSRAIPLTNIHSDTSMQIEVKQLDEWAASNNMENRKSPSSPQPNTLVPKDFSGDTHVEHSGRDPLPSLPGYLPLLFLSGRSYLQYFGYGSRIPGVQPALTRSTQATPHLPAPWGFRQLTQAADYPTFIPPSL